jgi:hypothetical protein
MPPGDGLEPWLGGLSVLFLSVSLALASYCAVMKIIKYKIKTKIRVSK